MFLQAIIFCIFVYKKLKSFFPHNCKISCSKAINKRNPKTHALSKNNNSKMQIAPGLNMNMVSTAIASSNKYFMEDRYPEEIGTPYVPNDWNSIFISSLPAGFDNADKLGYLIEVILKLGRVKRIDYAKHGTTGKPLAFIHFKHWNNGIGIQKFRKDMESMGHIDLMGTHTFWTSSIEINYRNHGNTDSYSHLNKFFPDVPQGTYLRMMINKNPIQDTILNIHQIAANADELHEKVIKLEEELTETKTELATNTNLLHDVMAKYELLASKLQYVMENWIPPHTDMSKTFSLDDLAIATEDSGPLSIEDLVTEEEEDQFDEISLTSSTIVNQDEIDAAALDLFKFTGIVEDNNNN
jgi:hypothetical protein